MLLEQPAQLRELSTQGSLCVVHDSLDSVVPADGSPPIVSPAADEVSRRGHITFSTATAAAAAASTSATQMSVYPAHASELTRPARRRPARWRAVRDRNVVPWPLHEDQQERRQRDGDDFVPRPLAGIKSETGGRARWRRRGGLLQLYARWSPNPPLPRRICTGRTKTKA